jgi:DNA-binding MarR family transcriptional regulator
MQETRPLKDTILWSVMRDHGFSNSVRDVFKAIYLDLEFDRFTQVNVHRLAEHLGLWPKTVASAMRQLERKGIISRGTGSGVSVRFRLNSSYGWIGSQPAGRKEQERAVAPAVDRMSA